MKKITTLSAVLVALAASGCLTQRNLDSAPVSMAPIAEPRLELVREKDAAGRVVRERFVLTQQGERPIAHGADKGFHPDGSKSFERRFDHSTPTGHWRSWHPNGQLESEVEFAGPTIERPMRFWYQNGQVSAEGNARNGSRSGIWRYYRPEGALREEGLYEDSLREGKWTQWELDGTATEITYRHGIVLERKTLPAPAAPANGAR